MKKKHQKKFLHNLHKNDGTQVSMKSKENMDSLKQELEEETKRKKIGQKKTGKKKKRPNESKIEIK